LEFLKLSRREKIRRIGRLGRAWEKRGGANKMKTLKPNFENQLFKKHYVYWAFGSAVFPPHTDVRPNFLFAKVGIADDTRKRIQSMQTDCPAVLHTVLGIPCPSKREAAVQYRIKKKRLHEWHKAQCKKIESLDWHSLLNFHGNY
jgi:hypothetical protein